MAKVLLAGSVLAIFLLVIGVILVRLELVAVPDKPPAFSKLLPGDIAFSPVAWLYTGTWLLMFIPVFGLLAALVGAIHERDWRLLMSIVLLLFVLSQGLFSVALI